MAEKAVCKHIISVSVSLCQWLCALVCLSVCVSVLEHVSNTGKNYTLWHSLEAIALPQLTIKRNIRLA